MNKDIFNIQATVFIIDDYKYGLTFITKLLQSINLKIKAYSSAQAFLNDFKQNQPGCLILDLCLPGMGGVELYQRLRKNNINLPVIILTSYADVSIAVKLMKAGVFDFFEKHPSPPLFLERVQQAIKLDACQRCKQTKKQEFLARIEKLTPRQREVMDLLLEGQPNKIMANKLGISSRTIESHHTAIMRTMQTTHIAELIQIAAFCELLPKPYQLTCHYCEVENEYQN
ncbi:two-component response regulator [Beggiatoa sp. PS]|nr:two-component response regulator [Beggiatoa sp. PS]